MGLFSRLFGRADPTPKHKHKTESESELVAATITGSRTKSPTAAVHLPKSSLAESRIKRSFVPRRRIELLASPSLTVASTSPPASSSPQKRNYAAITSTISTPHPSRKRPRLSSILPSTPRSPTRSPLIRRIPSMLRDNEEFDDRAVRESTPRSKRLRRQSSGNFGILERGSREGTTMSRLRRESREMSGLRQETREETMEAEDSRVDEGEVSLIDLEDSVRIAALREEEGFTKQEAELFLRIQNRGLEPIMPKHWQPDFETMPDKLFFPEEGNEPGYIDSLKVEGTFVGSAAMKALIGMGPLARGRIEAKRDPEDRVLAGIKKYIQWSVEDVENSSRSPYPSA